MQTPTTAFHRSVSLFLVALVATGLLVVGCDSNGSSMDDSLEESGTLSLSMTGAQGGSASTLDQTQVGPPSVSDLDSALVTIDEVSIVPVEDTSEGDSTETGVSVLSSENFEVDLVQLEAGLDTTVAEMDIEPGTYSQIRLITADEAEVFFTDGTEENVMIASGQQTGLKINFDPFTIESAEDEVEVSLNWAVEESLKGSPQGQFVITPVIDATVDTTSAGS